MNRIILDELGRRWWFWGLICLSCLILGVSSATEKNLAYGAFYPALLSISILALNLRSGRVLLALPFTARQIGRTFWVLYVVIPSILLALFSGLGIFIYSYFATLPGVFLPEWFQLLVLGSLGFGSVFWVFGGGPLNWFFRLLKGRWQNCLWVPIYLWGFLFALIAGGYLLAKSAISDEIKLVTLCLVGLVFTVLGWFRAEGVVIEHATYRKEIASAGNPKGTSRPRTGYGGIPYLIVNCCVRYLSLMAMMAALAFGISIWNDHRINWHDILGFMKVFRFYFVILCFWIALLIGMHPKFLRSLPLTSKGLSAVILSLPITPFLILCGIFTLIDIQTAGTSAALSLLKGELLCVAPLCAFTTAVIWNREKNFARIVMAVTVFILSAIPATYQLVWTSGKDLGLWMIIVVPLVSFSVALFIISRLLERNDMTYRVQMQTLTDPQTLGW